MRKTKIICTLSPACEDEETMTRMCLAGMNVARMVSRFRPPVDILGLTTDEKTWRKLALSWGVIPVRCERFTSTDVLFYTAKKLAQQIFGLAPGDRLVLTGGITNGTSGNTDLLKIETI